MTIWTRFQAARLIRGARSDWRLVSPGCEQLLTITQESRIKIKRTDFLNLESQIYWTDIGNFANVNATIAVQGKILLDLFCGFLRGERLGVMVARHLPLGDLARAPEGLSAALRARAPLFNGSR
jgi:hypothetical protein